jgi:hypothetical protein
LPQDPRLAALRWRQDQVGDGAAVLAQLALALQPVPPRGAQVALGAIDVAETDVGHPLARLPGAHFAEVRAGLSLRVPYPAKYFQGLIGLAAHLRILSAGTVVPIRLYSAAADASAVYVAGHNRWFNNQNACNTKGQGAINEPRHYLHH